MFTRTEYGQINKYLFYPEILVWVEGEDDYPFYEPVVHQWPCRIEAAGGKDKCKKLAEKVIENNYPFVVVMDGDYDILEVQENLHQRVLVLKKYSIENYLFERNVMQNVCCKYVGSKDYYEEIGDLFDDLDKEIETNLFNLIVLDIANYRLGLGVDFFPGHAARIMSLPSLRCKPEQVAAVCGAINPKVRAKDFAVFEQLVKGFVDKARFSDLIRGHFLFDVIRQFLIGCVEKIRDRKIVIDNDSLLVMLSLEFWNAIPTDVHKNLIDDLSVAITESQSIKTKASPIQ